MRFDFATIRGKSRFKILEICLIRSNSAEHFFSCHNAFAKNSEDFKISLYTERKMAHFINWFKR